MLRTSRRVGLTALASCALLLVPLATSATATAAENAQAPPALPAVTDPAPFGCIESDPDPTHNRFTVCTNDVTGRSAPDAVVVDELKRLVDRTNGPSDRIRISMFQWWYYKNTNPPFDYDRLHALTHAIIDAANQRNVDVEILIDDVSDPDENPELQVDGLTQPFTELQQALGDRVTVCDDDSFCLRNGNENAINHNKFFLLQIDGVEHVVLTSTNLVPNAQSAYENLIHIRWDTALYNFFLGYWERLRAGSWQGWDTAAARERLGGVVPADGTIKTKGYAYPRYHRESNDTVLQILGGIEACPDPYNRKVWVSMSGVTMNRLADFDNAMLDRFAQLTGMGCAVKFLVDDAVPTDVRSALQNRGVDLVVVPYLHHKFIVVDAVSESMSGGPAVPREFVWTGAHNLSWSSAWRDGEGAVWVEQPRVVRSYVSHFTCVWNRNRVDGGDDDSAC
jgi:hypothetical protein